MNLTDVSYKEISVKIFQSRQISMRLPETAIAGYIKDNLIKS